MRRPSRLATRSRLLAALARLAALAPTDRLRAALRSSRLRRDTRALVAALRRGMRRALRHIGRQPGHLARVLRLLGSRLRSRRQCRDRQETEQR